MSIVPVRLDRVVWREQGGLSYVSLIEIEGEAPQGFTVPLSESQAELLTRCVENRYPARPGPYELLEEILSLARMHVDQVVIVPGETVRYEALLIILEEGRPPIKMDVRPSDGIILALRCGASLWADEQFWQG